MGTVGGGSRGSDDGERVMAQKWVWPYRRFKTNLERVSGDWGIFHDIGFSGDHLYHAGKIGADNSFTKKSEMFRKRSDALKFIKQHSTSTNPRGMTGLHPPRSVSTHEQAK